MRILRIMLAAVLFVACVFLATANMHDVALVLPNVPIAGWPQMREVQVPLFVVVLGTLVVGVVITGLGTLFEQLRLRGAARRARKERKRAEAARDAAERERDTAVRDCEAIRAELVEARAQTADVRLELDRVRSELQSSREAARRSVESAVPVPASGADAAPKA